jgi:hypothetical protein
VLRDPRLTAYVELLPRYRALLQQLAASDERGTAVLYLGIKLCAGKRYLNAVTRGYRALQHLRAEDPGYPRRWARLADDIDSFVFAAYGALDALAQLIVTAYAVEAAEEVKFPALARILAAAPASAAAAVREYVAATCAAPWFRDLRRLRNLINYRSVLPAVPWTGAPAADPAAYRGPWPAPPSPALASLEALPGYCTSAQAHVAATVEEALGLLATAGVLG